MKYIVTILIGLLSFKGQAQNRTDSPAAVPVPVDSAARARAGAAQLRQDSVRKAVVQDSLRNIALRDSLKQAELIRFLRMADSSRYNQHPFFRFKSPERRISKLRQWEGKEGLFYGIVAIILLFGLLRNTFARYLADLFRTYFRTTVRQRVFKEQVANAPLPSLLFNILFLLIGALLAALLLRHFGLGMPYPFWQLFLYGLLGLGVVYITKFLMLKLLGWLLNAREATDSYIFIVFANNKVLGILLLPLVLGLAFSSGDIYQVFFALSVVLICGLFLYRFYLSFVTVQKLVQINLFHFLLYFFALEIAPLLLINKLLVEFFAQKS